jgi:hypothetical protein
VLFRSNATYRKPDVIGRDHRVTNTGSLNVSFWDQASTPPRDRGGRPERNPSLQYFQWVPGPKPGSAGHVALQQSRQAFACRVMS